MKLDKLYIGAAFALLLLLFALEAPAQVLSPSAASGAAAQAAGIAGAGAAATGNEINIGASVIPANTRQELNYDGDYTIRNVPNVIAPNIYPTAPCMGSSSIGGSVAGFGVTGGTSWIYENCEHRENARLLHAMNDMANAKIALCMQTTMANHPMCAKPAQQPAAKTSALDTKQISEEERRRAVSTGLTVGQDGTLWKCVGNANGLCDWVQAKLDPIAGQLK